LPATNNAELLIDGGVGYTYLNATAGIEASVVRFPER
jgi:hypothetical protein